MNRRAFVKQLSIGTGAMALPALGAAQVAAPAGSTITPRPAPAPRAGELRFRQVHLDNHTSPLIPKIGKDFKAAEFVATLKAAAVNSITIFAKCHHGMAYYPTKVGVPHPHLQFDLLGQMIEACHQADIRTPIYISVQWDEWAAEQHPEWRILDAEGRPDGAGPLEAGWRRLCLNTPYLDYLAAQTEEIVKLYPVDCVFFDIMRYTTNVGCFCPRCMAEKEKLGLDPTNAADRLTHLRLIMERGLEKLTGIVRQHKPQALVFYNSRMRVGIRPELKYFTHLEIESLPGGNWGYTHFQMMSRYVRNLGKDFMGMTGRFHRSWGDFGTVRNQAALDYECFSMLAQGAKCSIGDQLHPRGRLEQAVFERIGRTYQRVAEKEPWCLGAQAVTEIGFLSSMKDELPCVLPKQDQGITRMLGQLHHQYDMLDRESDFTRYKVIILPDTHRLDAVLLEKAQAYLAGGGKLLLSHESGLDLEGKRFVLPDIGVTYEGPAKDLIRYVEVLDPLGADTPRMEHVAYETGALVKALPDTLVLARIWQSFFDRDYSHFCSHKQTPYDAPTDYAAIVQRGNIIYFANPIFRTYFLNSYQVDKQMVANCLKRFLPEPLVETNAPSTAQITVTEQPGRQIVHLLHYVAERRTPDIDIVEDVIPLAQVKLSLRTGRRPQQVYLAPQCQAVAFEFTAPYTRLTVPVVIGHQMVVFEM